MVRPFAALLAADVVGCSERIRADREVTLVAFKTLALGATLVAREGEEPWWKPTSVLGNPSPA